MTIKQIINSKNKKIDSLLLEFEKEIATFSGKLKNSLRKLVSENKLTRDSVLGSFEYLGFDDIAEEFIDKYSELFTFSKQLSKAVGYDFKLSSNSLAVLEEISLNDSMTLLTSKDVIANNILRTGLQAQIEKKSLNQIVAELSKEIDSVGRRLSTEAFTGISNFERSLKSIQFRESGIEKYIYFGPVSKRESCKAVLADARQGTGWTREEINASPVDFVSGGGWNCRHEFLPYVEKLV